MEVGIEISMTSKESVSALIIEDLSGKKSLLSFSNWVQSKIISKFKQYQF